MHKITFSLLIVAALAGCIGADDDATPATPTDTPPEQAIPFGDGHDHADAAAHRHQYAATLLDTLGPDVLPGDEEFIPGPHAADVRGDLLVVAMFGDHAGNGPQGFVVIDVADPENMEVLSFYDAGVSVAGDRTIAFGPDGDFVFLGYEGGARPGVAAIDVRDPTAPFEAGFYEDPAGFGAHTVATGKIGDQTYVFLLSAGVTTLQWDGNEFTLAGKFITSDEGAILDTIPIAISDGGYAATYALRTLYGHDMNFYLDPETGIPMLLVAYAYDGLKILDMSNPSLPVYLARFIPEQDTGHRHYTHSVTAERLDDGRLIVVAGSETFEDENQGIPSPMWILDATEAVADGNPLSRPALLTTWSNPSAAPAEHLTTSLHFFRQMDGFLYVSHYHGGIWKLDLRSPEARADPIVVGYSMVVPDNPVAPPDECCIGFALGGIPMVFDVAVGEDGTAYAADIIQGISSVRFAA